MDEALGPGTVDTADFASGSVVESDLMAFTVGADAEEEAAVEGPVDFRFQEQLEIAELAQGGEEAALSGWVLHADDGAILHEPLAGQAVTWEVIVAFPAGQVFAVEQRPEAFGRSVRLVLCGARGKSQRAS
jgi:hypothetical protein